MGLAVVPYLVRRLGTEPYGIIGIISVLAGQLGVLHLGVGAAATRLISQGRGERDDRAVGEAMAGTLVVAGLAAALMAAVFSLVRMNDGVQDQITHEAAVLDFITPQRRPRRRVPRHPDSLGFGLPGKLETARAKGGSTPSGRRFEPRPVL